MKKWSHKEIEELREYEKLLFDLEFGQELDCKLEIQLLFLEAKFIISNKDVIGYLDSKPIGIFSVIEAIRKEKHYIKQGKLFLYHPVNFRNMEEFSSFLNFI
jgi:hypothetical protein